MTNRKQKKRSYIPSPTPHNPQHAQIQPPQTKPPLAEVPVRRLEVRAPRLALRVHVPAAAALVGHERQPQRFRDARDESAVRRDAAQSVADAEVAALERVQGVAQAGGGGGEEENAFGEGVGHDFSSDVLWGGKKREGRGGTKGCWMLSRWLGLLLRCVDGVKFSRRWCALWVVRVDGFAGVGFTTGDHQLISSLSLRANGLHESATACVIESRWRSMRNTVSANHAKSPGKQSNLSIDESQILEALR